MKKLSFSSLVTIAMLSGCQKDPELTKAENLISQFNCSVQDYSNSEDINERYNYNALKADEQDVRNLLANYKRGHYYLGEPLSKEIQKRLALYKNSCSSLGGKL